MLEKWANLHGDRSPFLLEKPHAITFLHSLNRSLLTGRILPLRPAERLISFDGLWREKSACEGAALPCCDVLSCSLASDVLSTCLQPAVHNSLRQVLVLMFGSRQVLYPQSEVQVNAITKRLYLSSRCVLSDGSGPRFTSTLSRCWWVISCSHRPKVMDD